MEQAVTRRGFVSSMAALGAAGLVKGATKTRNLLLVMTDGLRWQEVFAGADSALMDKQNGQVENPDQLRKEYWRDAPADRRAVLLPFVWTVMARNGQIYGNKPAGSESYVTNGMNFSYPGYNETLCGFADPRIDSNDKNPNPNVTMLEWLHRKPLIAAALRPSARGIHFRRSSMHARAGFPVNAGYDPLRSRRRIRGSSF